MGTRHGKIVALLQDGVEVFDSTKGGFLRDRTVQNGRCMGACSVSCFAYLAITYVLFCLLVLYFCVCLRIELCTSYCLFTCVSVRLSVCTALAGGRLVVATASDITVLDLTQFPNVRLLSFVCMVE